MLKLVRLALTRPYTFIVLAMLILLIGPLSALRTPTDIFPDIRIPVISVVWSYTGLQPDDMAGRIVTYYERALGTSVNDVAHIESQSFRGYGIVKIFFQPTVDIRTATAQVTSVSQTVLKQMPPGTTPPQILNYNASTVPVLQIALTSDTLDEQKLADYANNFIRPQLLSVPGVAIPTPYGGKTREVQIDLDPQALLAKKLSAQDVATALAQQNQIVPAGTQKIGRFEYNIKLNNSPHAFQKLNDLPIKVVDGAMIYIRDVAHVRDGYPPQSNVVRVDGHRAVLMSILKNGSASTLDIIAGVKAQLPRIETTLPPTLKLVTMGDQSTFVKGAVSGVAREGIIAAALTSAMILLFLGSWRSTLIIAASIPLAVLAAIAGLSAMGETLNVMTLGGLALAVGILVDDATVTIENINWHLEQGKDVKRAIVEGAQQIVGPAFVSLLCICIVFVPMLLLDGIARFLFVPMAEAVIFAMIASFVLSRTFVPMMAQYLLKPHASDKHASGEMAAIMDPHGGIPHAAPPGNPLVRFQRAFERHFRRVRAAYRIVLGLALTHRKRFVVGFVLVVGASFLLAPWLGRNFFPDIDSGEIALHVRAPVGTRIEDTAALFDHIENTVRRVIPRDQLANVIDNIGLPNSGINLTYNNSGTIGPQDGDILISLNENHARTADYVKTLREALPRAFPGTTFSFLPADIVSQILNFGSPAPVDLQVAGMDQDANRQYANELLRRVRMIAGIADARIQQAPTYPQFTVSVNRSQAGELGITEQDVTNSVVASLSGTSQVSPTYWLNPKNGVSYPIVAQTPQYRMSTLSSLENLPVTGKTGQAQLLGGIASFTRGEGDAVVSHYNIQPLYDIYATTQGRDLGAVAADIDHVVHATEKDLLQGSTVTLRGQVQTMNTAFVGLLLGLAGAIVLIYLLIVVNFHSWGDAFVIVTALPAALAGIVWMLFATHTPLSVPALTGAILCMGVATANSVLVVSFARERLAVTGDALVAALEAGFTRFRPVLMTALAMIIGMAPMALGLGDGGEQNAPLGRAVIGGLICATFATLLFVPVVFSLVHRRDAARHDPVPRASHGEPHDHPSSGSGALVSTEIEINAPDRLQHLKLVGIAALLIAAGIVATGIANRVHAKRRMTIWSADEAVPAVVAHAPSRESAPQALVLPGHLSAFVNAPIYARVSGYLHAWYADIGTHVKTGQLLGKIDTPDLDQRLAQARADLRNAQANERLAVSTAKRWSEMLQQDSVSQQEADEKNGDLTAKRAIVAASGANVKRLEVLESFKRITAPFDGVVTARTTDVGALINAGGGNGPELFSVSDARRLRVYVSVPQSEAAAIRPGMRATLSVPERPGMSFDAKLVDTDNSIAPSSGTLLVQLSVDNARGLLMPGEYTEVHFSLPSDSQALTIPASSLIFRQNGLQVAVVGKDDRAVLKPVTIATDFGTTVEIASGIDASDRVIDNPPDSLASGDHVRVASPQSTTLLAQRRDGARGHR